MVYECAIHKHMQYYAEATPLTLWCCALMPLKTTILLWHIAVP